MTGKDYTPASDNKSKKSGKEEKKDKSKKEEKKGEKMAPTVNTGGELSQEAQELLKKVSEQGDAVRKLKADSASQVI